MRSKPRLLLHHLPLLLGGLLTVAFSAEVPGLERFKTEETFGWWLVVVVPAAVALLLAQLLVWAWMLSRRKRR